MGVSFNFQKAITSLVGKSKSRSQMLLIFTEDGRIEERETPVVRSCIADDELSQGWLCNPINESRDESTNISYLAVAERSCIPIPLYKDNQISKLKELLDQIFHDSWMADLVKVQKANEADKAEARLYLMFGIPIILCVLVIGSRMLVRT